MKKLEQIQIGNTICLMGDDGVGITIERVKLGRSLGWHLHHGKTRILTKNMYRVSEYINEHGESKDLNGAIVDLGEF